MAPRHPDRSQALQAGLVLGVEAGGVGAVQVEHAQDPAVADQRHDDFRGRGGVAGDVAGEGVDVFDQLGAAFGDRRAADGSDGNQRPGR